MKLEFRSYQETAFQWLIQKTVVENRKGAGLFLDPGLGKTAVTLMWIRMLKLLDPSSKVLVIAPLRVIYSTWPEEIEQWDQASNLSYSIVHGNKEAAIKKDVDIYLINPEGLQWLEGQDFGHFHLVVDESTKFKSWTGERTKVLRRMIKVGQILKRIILTGTPSPNSLQDLFAQLFLLDEGLALGPNITSFRKRYCKKGGFRGHQWELREGADPLIWDRIAPICLRMSIKDHLDLPEMLIHDVNVTLTGKALSSYKRLEKELFLSLESGDILPMNEGAKYIKCKQVANGSVYDEDRNVSHIHSEKLDAISQIVDELQGKPVMIAYQFKHDLESLIKRFGKIPSISGGTKSKDAQSYIDKWNEGEIPMLAVQPQSLSHGVNMQKGPGRDIIWLGLPDQPEIYHQLNARIYRQGVSSEVRIHRVLARGTVDTAIKNRLEDKARNQQSMFDHLKAYARNAK